MNSGMRIICSGNTVLAKMMTNQKNPRRSRSATIAYPAAAPMTTASAGAVIAYSAVEAVPSDSRPRVQASAMLVSRPPRSPGCHTE